MAPEFVVGASRHLQKRSPPVRGRELERLLLPGGDQGLERRVEGARGEPLGLGLIDHPEARIDAGRGGMGGEHPPAEAVDRRDPGPLDPLERCLQGLELLALSAANAHGELLADSPSQLVRGPLGEGEGEDSARSDLRVERSGAEALDQHRGLPGSGSGAEEDILLAALDRGALLLGALRAHSSSPSSDQGSSSGSPRSRRQIGWKLHQSGQLPPIGSRITLPRLDRGDDLLGLLLGGVERRLEVLVLEMVPRPRVEARQLIRELLAQEALWGAVTGAAQRPVEAAGEIVSPELARARACRAAAGACRASPASRRRRRPCRPTCSPGPAPLRPGRGRCGRSGRGRRHWKGAAAPALSRRSRRRPRCGRG